jgi:hypothetical protein
MLEYSSGSFFLVSFFFWPCVSILPFGYCVVAEAGCNWYISILIYSLYKKKSNLDIRSWFPFPRQGFVSPRDDPKEKTANGAWQQNL